MAETGSQILNYTGNANLATGSNPNIPAIDPKADLDVINRTARDISMMNHENNIKLYQQKINDRDTMLGMLAKGEIASGKIDDADRKYYDKGKQEMEDSFYDMVANGGINNPKAYKNFLDKATNLNNVATWAQGRQTELSKLEQERAGMTLKKDIDSYTKHIDEQKKKEFWQPIAPYQKAFNFNIDSMRSSIAGSPIEGEAIGQVSGGQQSPTSVTTTSTDRGGVKTNTVTTKTSPLRSGLISNTKSKSPITVTGSQVNEDGTISPISYTPEKYWDLNTLIKNADEDLASNQDQAENQREWLRNVTAYNEDGKKELITAYNKRLAQYSNERGIAPIGTNDDGSPKFQSQIQTVTGPDGTVQIRETPATFAAKSTLASIDGDYVQKPQSQFNDKIGAYNVAMKKANTDSFYKHAMANNAYRKTTGYLDNIKQQIKLRANGEQQDSFLNDLYTKNTLAQKLLQGTGDGNLKIQNVPIDNSTPLFYFDGKGFKKMSGIGGQKKQVIVNGKLATTEVGGDYIPKIIFKGQPVSPSQITKMYHTFRKNAGGKFKGNINDFMNGYITNGLLEVNYQGTDANGNPVTTNKEISNAALRAMTTKKGQSSVFNDDTQMPTDEQIPDDNQ